MKKFIVAVLSTGMMFGLMGSTPALASGNTYDSKNFYCTSGRTNASVKMWEKGLSGTMQFEVYFIAQEYRNGSWHNVNSKEFSSHVFRNDYQGHYYGWLSYYYTWNTNLYHRELVKMIWWHRNSTYVVARKSLVTRSCH